MVVLRRLAPLVAGALAAAVYLLMPPLGGGSDLLRASSAPLIAPRWPVDDRDRVAPALDLGRGEQDLAVSPGHGPRTGFLPATSPRELLLSFDDGPDLKGTPLILEELDRRGLKAIFFVAGWRLIGQRPEDVARRDLVRKIASHGHLVANHTMNHRNLCRNPEDQAAEIDSNSELLAQATGLRPLLFRAPYGAFCRSLAAALEERDLVDIGWNLDPQDWKNTNEEAIFKYLTTKLAKLEGRGILLLHDTHAAAVRTLPQVLDWIARQNHRAVKDGQAPITVLDYSAVLPRRPMAQSGLELVVGRLLADVASPVQRFLPARP
jgi:peptidoglycan/xylan/chitin deacetylase (PgdA/CDA1 family)